MIITFLLFSAAIIGGILLLTAILYSSGLVYANMQAHSNKEQANLDASGSAYAEKSNDKKVPMKAKLNCNMTAEKLKKAFQISGFSDCRTLESSFNGNLICKYGCLGLGSCARICPNDAISIRNGNIRITDDCSGCGLCISICPKQLIELMPVENQESYSCRACGNNSILDACPTAKNSFRIDPAEKTQSNFKLLRPRSILSSEQRKP